ncbi:MAG: peptidylprolyl isomerase [bacterium]
MIKKKFLLLLTFVVSMEALWAQEVLDKIVAIVDDKIILQSELFQYTYSLALQLGLDPQKEPDKFDKLRQQTLNNIITQKVLLVKAKEDSIVVNDKQVDAVLEEQIQQMVGQLGSEEKVEKYFGLTLKEIKRNFRNEVREGLLVRTLRDKKDREVQISRREIEEFYKVFRDSLPELKESIRISHILLNVEPSEAAVAAARQKAEEILNRLKKGENFEELARQYSEDAGSSSRGGNLGFIERGDFVKEFEETAFLLNPGDISEIVRTRFGFHIIQLIERRGEKINTRHILIRLDTSPEDEKTTVEKLKNFKEQIQNGEITFEEVAKKYSKDESTASKGGDLGWFQIDQFQIESFKKAIVGLKEGEISDPVKTKFGYHLIKVNERRPARKLNITKDWEQIEQWALNLKRGSEFEKWVEEIKNDVYIEVKE